MAEYQLSERQREYRRGYIEDYAEKMRGREDPTRICGGCNVPGDCRDERSMFSAWMPLRDVDRPELGPLFDDIKGYWVCAGCVQTRLTER